MADHLPCGVVCVWRSRSAMAPPRASSAATRPSRKSSQYPARNTSIVVANRHTVAESAPSRSNRRLVAQRVCNRRTRSHQPLEIPIGRPQLLEHRSNLRAIGLGICSERRLVFRCRLRWLVENDADAGELSSQERHAHDEPPFPSMRRRTRSDSSASDVAVRSRPAGRSGLAACSRLSAGNPSAS